MKTVVKQGGFTLVETLIVLAIMATLFVIAIGQLDTTQHDLSFHTAVNDLQQELQSVINDASSGNYMASNTSCTSGIPATNTPILGRSSQPLQGTNNGCTFLGAVLAFGSSTGNAPSTNDTTTFRIYPIAAGDIESGGGSVSDYNIAAMAPTATNPNIPNLVNTFKISNGLNLDRHNGASLSGVPILIAIAYYSGPSVGTGLTSQSTDEALYKVNTASSPSIGASTYVSDLIEGSLLSLDPSSESLCFSSGTTANQSALITLGNSSNNSVSVSSNIYSDSTC